MRPTITSLSLLLCSSVLLSERTQACDGIPSTTSTTSNPAAQTPLGDLAPVASYGSLEQEARLPQAVRAKVRALPASIVHAPGTSPLVRGLQELAIADPANHRYAVGQAPNHAWYASHGGVGSYTAGASDKPQALIDGFATRLDQDQLGDTAHAAMLEMDAQNIPEGTHAEYSYTQYSATMDLNVSSVKLKGVFTEVLQAPRIITTANATIYAGTVSYPIELPNVQVDHVSTQVKVPAGATIDDGGGVATLSPRDPRMVLKSMHETMADLETDHPSLAFVYSTVPVTVAGNYQRNWYNQELRTWCATNHRPLLDVADLLSRDTSGEPQRDAQGARLAPDLVDPANGTLNQRGRERLAKAWWWMMARISGWTPGNVP